MSRAFGKPIRMTRKKRKIEVLYTVGSLTARSKYKRCTMTQVAKRIGLRPSTHLMNILNELWAESKIGGEQDRNTKGNIVYYWWIEGTIPI